MKTNVRKSLLYRLMFWTLLSLVPTAAAQESEQGEPPVDIYRASVEIQVAIIACDWESKERTLDKPLLGFPKPLRKSIYLAIKSLRSEKKFPRGQGSQACENALNSYTYEANTRALIEKSIAIFKERDRANRRQR